MVAARPGRTIFESERDRQRRWDLAISMMDWNRVLLQAIGLHMSRRQASEHGQRLFSTDAETAVCGPCIRDVLLRVDDNDVATPEAEQAYDEWAALPCDERYPPA